ncbi:MAG: RrF2 family transcriptional regulator [Candidatus Planktophila sp.]
MKISAKVDYALQAMIEIAVATKKDTLISAEEISHRRDIPEKFLEGILTLLRKAEVVNSYRGPAGGFELAKRPEDVTVADIIRIIDGPLAAVRGFAPEEIDYAGPVKNVSDVWIATRSALRMVLENISIADIIEGDFDPTVAKLINEKDARKRRRIS